MLPKERIHLAGLAAEAVTSQFEVPPGLIYQESVQHKMVLLLQAVDRAVSAVQRPMLFADIVPGYDLAILRNPDAEVAAVSEEEGFDPRAVSAIDETCLSLFSVALERLLDQQPVQQQPQGAFVYEGGDGLYYFAFKSRYRNIVLKEIGVSKDGLVPGGLLQ